MASTIDRSLPATNSPASSAEMRGQFGAAADDVEALQAGKEDAGTAAAAVSAHDGNAGAHPGTFDAAGTASAAVAAHDSSGTAHGGVENAFSAHTSGQTNSHGQIDSHIASAANPHGVNAAQVGALEDVFTANGDLVTQVAGSTAKLGIGTNGQVLKVAGGLPAWEDESAGGGSGTLTTVRKNSGADVSTGRARLNFIEGANVTIDIADDAPGDEADITITSTASGGGGGDMLSPATIAVGELYQAGDTSGVQTARSNILAANLATMAAAGTNGNLLQSAGNDKTLSDSGVSTASVSGHIADGSVHFTEASIDHANIQNVGTNSHATIDILLATALYDSQNNTVNKGAGQGALTFDLESPDDVVRLRIKPGVGSVNSQVFDWWANGTSLDLRALNDDYSVTSRTVAQYSHAGDVDFPAGVVTEQNVGLHQPATNEITGSVTVSLAPGATPRNYCNVATTLTITAPSSGDGIASLHLGPLADNVSFSGFTRIMGTPRAAGKAADAKIERFADGTTTLAWGAQEA